MLGAPDTAYHPVEVPGCAAAETSHWRSGPHGPFRGARRSPCAQYLAGPRVTVTDDPRLSVTVRLHELMVPHGSATERLSSRKPSFAVPRFGWAGMIRLPVEVTYTEYGALTLTSNPSTTSLNRCPL